MINMISLNTLDGKPNVAPDDQPDADLATDLFASLLIAHISMPPVNVAVLDPPQNDLTETPFSVSLLGSPFASGSAKDAAEFSFLPAITIPGGGDLIGSVDAKISDAVFSDDAFPEKQSDTFVPDGLITRDSQTRMVGEVSVAAVSNTIVDGQVIDPSSLITKTEHGPLPPEFGQRPKASEIAALTDTDIGPTSSPSVVTPQQIFSEQPPATPPVMAGIASTDAPAPPSLSDEQSVPEKSSPFSQDAIFDNKANGNSVIVPKEVDIDVSVKKFLIPKPYTSPPWVRLPDNFKDVSSIVRDDNSLKASSVASVISERAVIEAADQIVSDDAGGNVLDLTTTGPIIPDKKPKLPDSGIGTIFDASLNEAVKTTHVSNVPATEIAVREKIIQQVEPRIMELAAALQNNGEKRVLKIRLTPPELGNVEVTLQKNASGRIDAHFQAESHETRQILNDGLVQLRESMERSGMHVGDLDTSFGSFSSTGNENRQDQTQKFGTAEVLAADTINLDGISKGEDDAGGRLVNLRA